MDPFARFIKLLTALGMIILAASIVFFSIELSQFRQQLPILLKQIDETTQRVSPIIDEINDIKKFIPQIIQQSEGYQQQIPIILTQVSAINLSIKPILEQSQQWQSKLPKLLKAISETNKTIGNTNKIIAKALPQIPLILDESKALRAEIPEMLDKTESLMGQAEQAGKDASKGLVTGFVGGILSTPFTLLDNIGSNTIKKLHLKDGRSLSKEDRKYYDKAMARLMEKPKKGAKQTWSNSKSGNKGSIIIDKIVKQGESKCYKFANHFTIAKGDDQGVHELTIDTCDK